MSLPSRHRAALKPQMRVQPGGPVNAPGTNQNAAVGGVEAYRPALTAADIPPEPAVLRGTRTGGRARDTENNRSCFAPCPRSAMSGRSGEMEGDVAVDDVE